MTHEMLDQAARQAGCLMRRCTSQFITPSNETLNRVEDLMKRSLHGSCLSESSKDTIDALVGALCFDASTAAPAQHTSSDVADMRRITMLLQLIEGWLPGLEGSAVVSEKNRPHIHIPVANALFKASVALMGMLLNKEIDAIRYDRHRYLGALNDYTDARDALQVSDITMAALPRPTKELLDICREDGRRASTTGMLYAKTYQVVQAPWR